MNQESWGRLAVMVASVTICACWPASSKPSLDQLLKTCAQKVGFINADGVLIGYRTDGYCSGFLEGAYTVLLQRGAICEKVEDAKPVSIDFLISIVDRYRADNSSETDIAIVVDKALSRAFPCGGR
jgi:hypothetical protein